MDKLMLRKGRVYLFYLLTGLAIASALLLSGCGGGGSGGSGGDESTSARFSFTLTSYLSQTVASQPAAASQPLAVSLVSGQLSVTNTATLVTDIYPWSVYLDDQTLVVTSNGNLVLAPGTYDFALLLTDGAQQYAGTLLNQAVVDGVNNLAMTVQPIIGDTVSDVSAVDNLAEFRFSYDPSELAGFSDPQIGLILDGAPEQIFIVNPATGLGDLWANIPPGPHTIQLRFYDGPTQLGKSVPAQESQTVTAGGNILMDLIALAGDIDFTLTADGGDGTFNFTIPAEIVDEAGGVGNLEALFSLVGTLNPYQEQLLTVLPDGGGNYQAAAVLPGLFYEDVTLSLAFTDIGLSPSQPLGSCLMPVTLGGAQNNLTCNITLVRRAVVGGNLLATVGVTAVDDVGAPVAGASVLIDGVQVGLTNATGFVKVFTLAGPHILRAEAGSTFGEVPLNAAPLGIHNEVVVLDQVLAAGLGSVFVYAANYGDGTVSAYAVDGATGALTEVLGSPFPAGPQPIGVAANSIGQVLFVANNSAASVSMFTIDPGTGALIPTPGSPFGTCIGPYDFAITPDSAYLYVGCESGQVSAFSIDLGSGMLTAVAGSPYSAGPGTRRLAMTPDGAYLFAANAAADTISAFSVDAASGVLTTVPGSPFDNGTGTEPTTPVVSDTGDFLYVASRTGGVAAYSIDAGTGALTTVPGSPFFAGTQPHAMAAQPSGPYAFVADAAGSNLHGYQVDGASGALTPIAGSPFVGGSASLDVAIESSGRFLYATAIGDNSVHARQIDIATGALTAVPGSPFAAGATTLAIEVVTVSVPPAGYSTLFTDDFNRADGLLTAPWVTTIQGASTLGIVSNQLQAYAPDASPMAMYGSAITPGTPVRTSIDVNISGGNYDNDLNNNGAPIWLLVHSNQSGASWSSAYACGLMNNQLQLLSISVPTITPLATGSQAHSTLNGSSYRIQLTVNAGQLTCESFVGGLPFDSAVASDAAFDGGFTGLLGGDNSTTLKWDNYLLETGSAPAVPASIDGTYVDACRAQGPFDSRQEVWNVAAGVITENSNIYQLDTTCSGAVDVTNTIVHTLNYTGSKTLGTGELVHTVIVTPTQRLFTPQTQLGADNYNNNVYYGFTDWTVGLTKDVTALNEDGSPNPNTPFQAIAYVDMTVTPNVLRIGTELPVDGLGYPEQLEPGGLPRQ